MERSVHDALCVVKRVLESNQVVAGGGAVEAALSVFLENFATSIVSGWEKGGGGSECVCVCVCVRACVCACVCEEVMSLSSTRDYCINNNNLLPEAIYLLLLTRMKC